MKGFLLGLTNGTICLSYCAPVLVPYFLGEGHTIRNNYIKLVEFLTGRLFGYIIFGVFAWLFSNLLKNSSYKELFYGLTYFVLAVSLIIFGIKKSKVVCAAEPVKGFLQKKVWDKPQFARVFTCLLGFLTGLNLCPPFLLAFTNAAATGDFGYCILFFITFFLGTSLYFFPIPLIGAFKRVEVLRIIGRFTAVIVGGYYLYLGMIIFLGGIQKL